MDFSKYKYFYVNGCSHVEGGGLEEPSIRGDSVLPLYEKIYEVSWKNRTEVNFAARLSKLIGLDFVNHAKCGSGTDRVVRTTYDFIHENWKDRHNFFIILENPDPSRSDVYLNDAKDYFIVNSRNDDKFEKIFSASVREYFNNEYRKTDYLYEDKLKSWFENHYSFNEKLKSDDRDFVGLYTFCKFHKIKIFVMNKTSLYFNNTFMTGDVIKFDEEDYNHWMFDINTWCRTKKLTIADELSGFSGDGHPGYFGHIKYADKLYEFLKNNNDE